MEHLTYIDPSFSIEFSNNLLLTGKLSTANRLITSYDRNELYQQKATIIALTIVQQVKNKIIELDERQLGSATIVYNNPNSRVTLDKMNDIQDSVVRLVYTYGFPWAEYDKLSIRLYQENFEVWKDKLSITANIQLNHLKLFELRLGQLIFAFNNIPL